MHICDTVCDHHDVTHYPHVSTAVAVIFRVIYKITRGPNKLLKCTSEPLTVTKHVSLPTQSLNVSLLTTRIWKNSISLETGYIALCSVWVPCAFYGGMRYGRKWECSILREDYVFWYNWFTEVCYVTTLSTSKIYSVGGELMNDYGAMVEWYWQGNTRAMWQKLHPHQFHRTPGFSSTYLSE